MEKKYELLLKGGNVFPINRVMDIGIKDGKIVEVKEHLEESEAREVIDVAGQTVSPGFADSHMHIDKALTADEDDTTNLLDACIRSENITREMYEGWPREDVLEDIVERSSKVIEMCVANGTTAIKNHVLVTDAWGMLAVDAMDILKERYKDKITIKSIVPYYEAYDKEWREAARQHRIDVIGGYPNMTANQRDGHSKYTLEYRKTVDQIFSLAKEYNLPIDLHVDESDSTNIDLFEYVVKKTFEEHLEGRVTCSHVTGISAKKIDEEYVADVLAWAAKARVRVATMTSCNMYLMDIGRRGPTRVKQMLDVGIDVSIASDNIRDPFRPFGNGDLLEEALLTAEVHKLFTRTELGYAAKMITLYPAENMLLEDYGVLPGCNADLVVLDAPDMQEAILSQVDKTYVLKKGKVIAKSGKLV